MQRAGTRNRQYLHKAGVEKVLCTVGNPRKFITSEALLSNGLYTYIFDVKNCNLVKITYLTK